MKRVATSNGQKAKKAKVLVGNGKVNVTFVEDEEKIVLSRREVPEYVKSNGIYMVGMREGEISSMWPVGATVKAKFKQFVSKKDEKPTPVLKPAGTGKRADGSTFPYPSYLAMTALIEITDANYRGMTIPVFLRYMFDDDGEGLTVIKGGGKNAELLESFLEAGGILDQDIKFSDNVLPSLQNRLLKAKKEFLVQINKDGYVDSFMEALDEETMDEDDDDWLTEETMEEDEVEEKPVSKKNGHKRIVEEEDDDDDPDYEDDIPF